MMIGWCHWNSRTAEATDIGQWYSIRDLRFDPDNPANRKDTIRNKEKQKKCMKMLTNSAASAKKRAKRKQKPTIEPESERACFQSDPKKANVYTRHFVPENFSCHSVAFKCSLFSNKQQNPIEPFERMKNCSVSFENSRSSQRKLSVFVEHSLA